MRALRGADIAMIFQEPMTALNPLYTVGDQIGEVLEHHEAMRKNEARGRAIELLRRTGIPDPERRVDAYPHQLSGGQRQRAMIAMALACRPRLLICDEPTTALDVTIQAQILALLDELQAEMQMALLFITHDLNLVRRFTHRVGVMERGKLVEMGDTGAVFDEPRHAYTKKLLASRPQRVVEPLAHDAPTLVEGRAITVDFAVRSGWFSTRHFVAVRNATLGAAPRRDARRRRRVGLGQDDARNGAARAAADRRRRGAGRRRAHGQRAARRPARHAQAHAGGIPGSVRIAQPAHDRRPDRRRGTGSASARAGDEPSARRSSSRCSTRSG